MTPDDRTSPAPRPEVPLSERMALRLDEVAGAVGVSRRTLERERAAGRFPKPDLKIGKALLWKPETIREWIDAGGAARPLAR